MCVNCELSSGVCVCVALHALCSVPLVLQSSDFLSDLYTCMITNTNVPGHVHGGTTDRPRGMYVCVWF